MRVVTDNKKFCITIKPFLSHKVSKSSKITTAEGNELISAGKDTAQKFDKFYKNAVSSLNIHCDSEFVNVMAWKIQLTQPFKNSKTNLALCPLKSIFLQKFLNFVKLILMSF